MTSLDIRPESQKQVSFSLQHIIHSNSFYRDIYFLHSVFRVFIE